MFSPLALVPVVLPKFLVEHVNGHLRHLILVVPCRMEAPRLPTLSAVSHHKRSHCGCFGRPGTQGSAISAFNPLAAQ